MKRNYVKLKMIFQVDLFETEVQLKCVGSETYYDNEIQD